MPHSRQTWVDLEKQPTLTDIQRTVLWYWRNRVGFGGKGMHFGTRRKGTAPTILRDFTEVAARLEGVIIEQQQAQQVISYYDSPEAFFFIDPPYVGTSQEAYDAPTWAAEERDALLEQLADLKGRWLLTIGGEISKTAMETVAVKVDEVMATYSIAGREHFARNYEV